MATQMTKQELMLYDLDVAGIDTAEILSYNYDDIGIDDAIERIKGNEADVERLKKLAQAKVDRIKLDLETQVNKLEKKIKWDKFHVQQAVLNAPDKKETKTQFKKTFVSGDVVIKKGTHKMSKPDAELETLEQRFPDFVEEVTDKKFKWAELKKELVLKDGRVFYEGEDVTDIVPVEFKPDEVVIK